MIGRRHGSRHPLGLMGRIILILTVGGFIAGGIAWGLHELDKARVLRESRVESLAERLVAPVALLARAAPQDRRALSRSLSDKRRRVWLTKGPVRLEADRFTDTTDLNDLVSTRLADLGVTKFRIAVVKAEDLPRDRRPPPRDRFFRDNDDDDEHHGAPWDRRHLAALSARLDEGAWVAVAQPVHPLTFISGPPGAPVVGIALTAFVIVLLLTVWGAWRAGRPLRAFTDATERLGRDVNAPPMDETRGPRETRRAARAFNEMQHRIRGFVEDRTRMLAAISHDLRTPITRMRLRAEFVEDGEQRDKMLSDLEEMEAMIAATLAFIRDDAAGEAARRVDLGALVAAVVEDARETGADATYDGPESLPFDGRPMALKRGVTNLVVNAVKYGERARVSLETRKETIRVTVDDDGPGIPDDQLDRVFDPFYRVDASRRRETGGTGLGLSVVRSVARAHGGEATLANRAEGGLRAVIVLPA